MHLPEYLYPMVISLRQSAKWFVICFALFVPLAYMFPGKRGQPYLRKDMSADALYWFIGPLVYAPIYGFIATFLLNSFYAHDTASELVSHGLWPLGRQPILLQVILILLATDFLQYWMHRLFHSARLWKFHSIHHSSRHVDWLSAARFHPINIILYSTLMGAIVFMLGFSPEAFAALFLFNVIYSPLVHANLNWDYGPFKYVLSSPVFHRWHHTSQAEGGDKNFAPTFPFIDLMFGTFYMPKGKQPMDFGAHNDTVPDHFIGQMVYPFKKRR